VSGIFDAARTLRVLILARLARLSSRRAGVALVYHRVGGAGGSEDFEILAAVSGADFKRQLRHLARSYRVVAAADLLEAVRSRRRGERFPVAITFDDDLSSHVLHALPALKASGLTATFFLAGRGRGHYWWQDLQCAVDKGLLGAEGLPNVPAAAVRSAAAREPRAILDVAGAIVRLEPAQRREVAATLREMVGDAHDDEALGPEGVMALSAAGCTIGFHTLAHEPLPALSDEELARALRDGREELGPGVNTIAYPHGKADQRTADAAQAAGYVCGFTSARGPVTTTTDAFLIPRTVADLSASELALRLARMFLGVH
jgi:peptidoglycan/xylan/chitin deacetylase (PgdA/CDA1 family)